MFHWFRVSKKFMRKRGITRFSVQIFMSHSTENFCRGTLLWFRNFLVSKRFRGRKKEVGSVTIFRRKFLNWQCRKHWWGNPSVFPKVFMDNRRYHDFSLEFSVSQCRKTSWVTLLWFRKFLVSNNFMGRKGEWESHNFRSKSFNLTMQEKIVGKPSVVQKFSGIENFYGKEGGGRDCHTFRSTIFNLTMPENIVENPSVSPKIWFSQKFYAY